MAIGLTPAEEVLVETQLGPDGISSDMSAIDYQIEQLNIQKAQAGSEAGIYQKFYDWWTTLSTHSETELEWSKGDYVTDPVTQTMINESAAGEETDLFPYSSGWANLYPFRIPSLYGTEASGKGDVIFPLPVVYGPYEYGQILNEEAAVVALQAWSGFVNAQITALNTYTIPGITSLIAEIDSEPGYASELATIRAAAVVSLAAANASLVNAQDTIDNYPSRVNRDPFLAIRKPEILARATWIDTNHLILYDNRYSWLNIMLNLSFGMTGESDSIDEAIAILQQEKDALQIKFDALGDAL